MSTNDNIVETVKQTWDCFGQGDFDGLAAFYASDMVFIRNLSTTLRHRRFLFTDSFLLLWKWRVG